MNTSPLPQQAEPSPSHLRSPPAPARSRPRRAAGALVAAAGVVALGAGAILWRSSGREPRLQLDTAQVDRGAIVAKVTASGTLSAIVTVQVGSQVSGRIAALYADFNSRVKKGQLIAKIDPALFEAAVEQARANDVAARGNLARAKAQAVDADRQYRRNQELARQKLIAQADLDTSQANADAANAAVSAAVGSVAQARAALRQAEVNLAYTNIVSPTDGVVISRSVDVGQTVAASLQAPTLFVIAQDLAKMQVDTSVAEADVGRLRDGMPVTFAVDAYPTETFQGRVRQIRNAPQTVQNVVTYDAVVDVDNSALKLRPGMTANVTFVYAEKDDVVRVPNAALRFHPPPEMSVRGEGGRRGGRGGVGATAGVPGTPGTPATLPRADATAGAGRAGTPDRRLVWVARGGRPQPVRIRTGISDGTLTEVLEGGLEPGDAVVTDSNAPARSAGAAPVRTRLF
jgi:HlyD family secretion protein